MSSRLRQEYLNHQAIRGGMKAHIARRVIHVSMIFIPLIYYYLLTPLLSKKILQVGVLFFVFCVFLIEKARIRYRFVMFGQRFYEAANISAFAWTMLSIGLVLFFSPAVSFSMAIIMTCALVDPLMGEMRMRKISAYWIILAGTIVAAVIWMFFVQIYALPFWLLLLMPPISVAAEWPSLRWIDDNAMMILIPLMVVMVLF